MRENYKILVVDDVPSNIRIVEAILKKDRYEVLSATNGVEALDRIKENIFDLILLDIVMPEMDGFEVCHILQKDPETKDIPVIFLTAKSETESIVKGLEIGAVDYVSKPFRAKELLARVKTHLELKTAREELEQRRLEIEREKEKSEALLLNILPKKVAHELKETGKTTPESFENVTVFFSDIVNFTPISESLAPEFLISELNDIFTAFDDIMTKHNCERIETIGDAYLAVCGMPVPNENHAENIINAALEIVDYMKERAKNSQIKWEVRIGVHSGKVVGGVVGIRKYSYNVFGDTINTAARMEQNSQPMKINISESTYQILQKKLNKFSKPIRFILRDPIEVKGKGEMMMYFVSL